MIKVFISQPMRGKTDEEILEERERFDSDQIEILDTFFTDHTDESNPLEFLGRSIIYLGKADLVYFIKDWDEARGCRIEHLCATEYGLTVIEE